jgi:hypothetical protein
VDSCVPDQRWQNNLATLFIYPDGAMADLALMPKRA